MIRLELPKALGLYVDGESAIDLPGDCSTVGEALASLGRRAPGVLDRVMDEKGEIRTHVNVFLNGESVRFLDGLGTPVPDGSAILILAAISGG